MRTARCNSVLFVALIVECGKQHTQLGHLKFFQAKWDRLAKSCQAELEAGGKIAPSHFQRIARARRPPPPARAQPLSEHDASEAEAGFGLARAREIGSRSWQRRSQSRAQVREVPVDSRR